MPRRPNSFVRALKDAEKRLEKALTERQLAKQKVVELDAEIPGLQKTIQALQQQVNPKEVMPNAGNQRPEPQTIAVTGEHRAETSAGIPPEIAKWVLPQALDGMGSVPPEPPPDPDIPKE